MEISTVIVAGRALRAPKPKLERHGLAEEKRAAIEFAPLERSARAPRDHESGRLAATPSDAVQTRADTIVTDAERLCREGSEDEAADLMLDALEWHLRNGEFDDVDAVLVELEPARLGTAVLLVVLTITWHGRDDLLERDGFVLRAERALRERLGAARAEALLASRR